ncbi:MAG: hypothetical protein AAF431_06875 [Pseudomonadota bacterium]
MQSSEFAVIPHMVKDIGFVLNPAMERTSLWAAEGDAYQINSLGLRGEQVRPKQQGVKRVLIVGDSIVFGWKLKDKNRLSTLLNQRVQKNRTGKADLEFITVALPGWNVKSAKAFLESHIQLLDPDLILWWSIPNDMEDVGGVVPPGIIARWASPHDQDESPFAGISNIYKRSGPFMPSVSERLDENLGLIQAFIDKTAVPVLLIDAAMIEGTKSTSLVSNQIYIPKKFQDDSRWRISPSDGHPSVWANVMVSVCILNRMSRIGFATQISFDKSEEAIANECQAPYLDQEIAKFRPVNNDELFANFPSYYRAEGQESSKAVLYGLSSSGEMLRSGTIFLRDPGGSSGIILQIDSSPNVSRFPMEAIFTVRDNMKEETATHFKFSSMKSQVKLPTPVGATGTRVFEISWSYRTSNCSGPAQCSVGTLVSADFE